MASKKVMFLVNHPSAGGIQEVLVNLAEGFSAKGYAVELATLYPNRKEVRETPPGLDWFYVTTTRPKVGINVLRALVSHLRKSAPDVIFTASPMANVLTPIAAKLAGLHCTIAISHHSPVETHKAALNWLDGITGAFSNVSTVISVSDAVGDSLRSKSERYKAKRLTIKNSLPPRIEKVLLDLAPHDFVRSAKGRTVVATGRLAEQKNYPVMLRAMSLLPDVRLQIVGAGPLESMLKGMARDLGVENRVDFLGHCTREQTMSTLASGDVFIQPSLFEGHSLGLIEAARLKLPLVVSDVPSQTEGVTGPGGEKCGLIVGLHDHESLAHEIRRLLDEPAYYAEWTAKADRLGRACDFQTMVAQYENLIPGASPASPRQQGA
jgi:glycosyltransferase involved in cell wall biosynthesis